MLIAFRNTSDTVQTKLTLLVYKRRLTDNKSSTMAVWAITNLKLFGEGYVAKFVEMENI